MKERRKDWDTFNTVEYTEKLLFGGVFKRGSQYRNINGKIKYNTTAILTKEGKMKRLKNKRGFYDPFSYITILIGLSLIWGAYKTAKGDYGKGGTEAVETCNQDDSCWFNADYLQP